MALRARLLSPVLTTSAVAAARRQQPRRVVLSSIDFASSCSSSRRQFHGLQQGQGLIGGGLSNDDTTTPVVENRAHFSTTSNDNKSASSWNPLSGMWDGYTDRKTKKNLRQQLEEIAGVDAWTLGTYHGLLGKTADAWTSKLPGVRGTAEVKNAKQSYEIVTGLLTVLGRNAVVEDLYNMDRLAKLKAADEANITVDKIEQEVVNFELTTQTHALLMELKRQGKGLPETQDEMKQAMKANAKKLVTKGQKARMEDMMRKKMMRNMKRR